jgi:hypothetical protein
MSSLPDNTQITTTQIIHDSDIFTDEDLERASAIFKKYYPGETLESIEAPDFELQSPEIPALTRPERQIAPLRISARELHKYPIYLVGIFLVFLVTYPIAMSRVSQAAKFAPYGAHLKSLTLEYRQSEVK